MSEVPQSLSEIIAAARERGVAPEKIAALEAGRDELRAKLQASDRKDAAARAVAAERAEAQRLAEVAERVGQDVTAMEGKHLAIFNKALEPYRAVVQSIAEQRAASAQRLLAAEAELATAQQAEADAWGTR